MTPTNNQNPPTSPTNTESRSPDQSVGAQPGKVEVPTPAPAAPEATPPVLPPKVEQPVAVETKPPEIPKAGESEEEKIIAEKAAAVAPPVGPEIFTEPSKKPDEKIVTPPPNQAEPSVEKLSVLQDEVGAILPPEK